MSPASVVEFQIYLGLIPKFNAYFFLLFYLRASFMLGSLFSHKLELHRMATELVLPWAHSTREAARESRDNAPGVAQF